MSEILNAVLRMPPEMWSDTPIDTRQRHSCYVEAANLIESLQAQLNEADRRAGAAERENVSLRRDICDRRRWLDEAKREAGYDANVSFDVVWAEALQAKNCLSELWVYLHRNFGEVFTCAQAAMRLRGFIPGEPKDELDEATRAKLIELAREDRGDDDTQIDDDAIISVSDDDGYWVQSWVWVGRSALGEEGENDE